MSCDLSDLQARGYTVQMVDGRLRLSPSSAPADVVETVKAHRAEIIGELLLVPEDLRGVPTEDMKALAFRLQGYIDGPAAYQERIRYLPAFERLAERINWRLEA